MAFRAIPSDNGSYRCRTTNFGSANGSCNTLCASYTHEGTGNADAGATDGGPRVTAGRYQKEIERAGQVRWKTPLRIHMDIPTGPGVDADGFHGCRDGGGQAYTGP